MSSKVLLEEVVNSCHYLESDKATDRKKHADTLKGLLEHPQVVAGLWQRSVKGKSHKDGTYTSVFKSVQGYLLKESELAREKWDGLNPTSQATKTQKLREISSLLRMVTRTACKNGPNIKCNDFIDSMLLIFKRNFQSKLFAATYLDILVEDVLVQRKYVCQINCYQYEELLSFVTSAYLDSREYVNSVQVTLALKSLLKCIIAQYDPGKFDFLFDFFQKTHNMIRTATSSAFTEHSLDCLILFVKWQAHADVEKVMSLYSSTVSSLVGLFASKKISHEGRTFTVELLEYYLYLHGAHHVRNGLLDEGLSCSDVKSIVTAAEKHVQKFASSVKYSSKMRSVFVNEKISRLTANCLHLLFTKFKNQECHQDLDNNLGCDRSKISAMRLERWSDILGYVDFCDNVVIQANWLQIMEDLFVNYSCDLSAEDLTKFTNSLHGKLKDTLHSDVTCKVLLCLAALAPKIPTSNCDDFVDSNSCKAEIKEWQKIWETAKHHAASSSSAKSTSVTNAALQLLSSLMKQNVVAQGKLLHSSASLILHHLWPAMSASASVSESMMKFIIDYIHAYGLVERAAFDRSFPSTWLSTDSDDTSCDGDTETRKQRPLRCALFDYFLGCTTVVFSAPASSTQISATQFRTQSSFCHSGDDAVPEESFTLTLPNLFLRDGFVSMTNLLDISKLAELLYTLCCKFPSFAAKPKEQLNMSLAQNVETASVNGSGGDWFECDLRKIVHVLSQVFRGQKLERAVSNPVDRSFFCVNLLQSCMTIRITKLVNHLEENLSSYQDGKNSNSNLEQALYILKLLLTMSIKYHCGNCATGQLLEAIGRHISEAKGNSSVDPSSLAESMSKLCEILCDALSSTSDMNTARKSTFVEQIASGLRHCCELALSYGRLYLLRIKKVDSDAKPQQSYGTSSASPRPSPISRFSMVSKEAPSRGGYKRRRYDVKESSDSPQAKRPNIVRSDEKNGDGAAIGDTRNASNLFKLCCKLLCGSGRLHVTNAKALNELSACIFSADLELSNQVSVEIVISFLQVVGAFVCELASDTFNDVIATIKTIFQLHYLDQAVCSACLACVSVILRALLKERSSCWDASKEDLLSVVGIVGDLISKDKCGPRVKVAYIGCLQSVIIQKASDVFRSSDENTPDDAWEDCDHLCQFVSDNNFTVALCCANAIAGVGRSLTCPRIGVEKFLTFFRKMLSSLQEERRKIAFSENDENFELQNVTSLPTSKVRNAVSAHLVALSGLISSIGHHLERELAFEVCALAGALTKSNFSSWKVTPFPEIFRNVLTRNVQDYAFKTGGFVQFFMSSHLEYILSKWPLDLKKGFENFPVEFVFGGCCDSFYETYSNAILPAILAKTIATQGMFCVKFEFKTFSNKELMSATPNIVAFIISHVCGKLSQTNRNNASLNANSARKLLEGLASATNHASVAAMAIDQLPDVIVALLRMFQTTTDDRDSPEEMVSHMFIHDPPPSTANQLNDDDFEACLRMLLMYCNNSTSQHESHYDVLSSFAKLLASNNGWLTLMMSLYKLLVETRNCYTQKRHVIAYRYFTLLLFPYIDNGLQKEMFLTCVIFNFANVINGMENVISRCVDASGLRQLLLTSASVVDHLVRIYTSVLSDDLSDSWKFSSIPVLVNTVTCSFAKLAQAVDRNPAKHLCHFETETFLYHVRKLTTTLTKTSTISRVYGNAMHELPGAYKALLTNNFDLDADALDTPPMTTVVSDNVELLDFLSRELDSVKALINSEHDFQLMLEGGIDGIATALYHPREDSSHLDSNIIDTKKSIILSFANVSSFSENIQESIARCLGCMGLLAVEEGAVLYHGQGSSNTFHSVLSHLYKLCHSSDPSKRDSAVKCVTSLTQYDTVNTILRNMSSDKHHRDTARFLEAFSSQRSRSSLLLVEPVKTLKANADWSCKPCSSGTHFTSSLCHKLLRASKADFIRCLDSFYSADFSGVFERLLPYVCLQLITDSSSDAIALGQCITRLFQSAVQPENGDRRKNVCTECLLRFLHVLQYVREHEKNDDGALASAQSIKVASHTQVEARSVDNLALLEMDYLLVARVALLCRQPFMAVLFVELWTDDLEKQLEESVKSNILPAIKNTSRALSFSSKKKDERNLSLSQEKKKQILTSRCQGLNSPMSLLQAASSAGGEAKSILISAYDMIGELDCLHGCYSSCPLGSVYDQTLLHVREMEGRWGDALKTHDLVISCNAASGSRASNMIESLQQTGLEHLCDVYLNNLENVANALNSEQMDEHLQDLQYKAAWNAGQWDETLLNVQKDLSGSQGAFHKNIYQCMSSLFGDESEKFEEILKKARIKCVSEFNAFHSNYVITCELYKTLSQLQCLKEIDDVQKCVSGKQSADTVLDAWPDYGDKTRTLKFGYDQIGLILSVRTTLLRHWTNRCTEVNDKLKISTALRNHLTDSLRVACRHDRLQNAQKLLHQLKTIDFCEEKTTSTKCDNIGHQFSYVVKLEEAKILWKQNEETFALASVQHIQHELEKSVGQISGSSSDALPLKLLLADALLTRGNWLHSSRCEGPTVIMEEYLERSVTLVEKVYSQYKRPSNRDGKKEAKKILEQLVTNYSTLAKFADAQYQQVMKYKKSSEYAQKRLLAAAPKEEVQSMQRSGQTPGRKTLVIVDKNQNIDKQELARIEKQALEFLSSALANYIKCLQMSDRHDMLMHRICALWLENQKLPATNKLMRDGHKVITSYKYIPLAYQLAARLHGTKTSDAFQQTLREILFRVAVDHPYHVLPVILALANANRDEDFSNPQTAIKRKSSKKSTPKSKISSKITAAGTLLERIRAERTKLVTKTEFVMNTYIEFANFDASPWKNQPRQKIEIPRSLSLHKLCSASKLCADIQDVAIPTVTTPIDRSCRYDDANVIKYRYVKPHFETCGGVNLPKVLNAVGSDGVTRKHLVKGRDDLRQDAVMQQVFETVNSLLAEEESTSSLRMRTYRVIPLSQCSGLVEWCGGTLPIGSYLVGNTQQNEPGAHQRYRPNDLPVIKCRKMMHAVANQPAATKIAKYREVCCNLSPVFRHFFTERFLDPAEWFAKSRLYTRSVAVASIVGYVVGLGDRHVQNILVDSKTAELIHIDLGVAFEQGKCLPTPETVPFRLTRDIVDGMGITGVEGVFRRCCERTMQVMRSSYDVITTIVEVLLYDPLHDWALTPSKALLKQRQAATEGSESVNLNNTLSGFVHGDFMQRIDEQGADQLNTNKLAERVLLRLQEKLRGNEEGSMLSVRGQVNMLIQQAADPDRLAQLFAGWQPYL